MSRVLRGAWSRRGTLGSLVAMTAVVVAGTVTVIGFARAAGTSMLLAAPLLLLGAVAVPAIGRELAAERREEIGLARLRGIRGPRLVAVLLAEPLLAVVAGTVLGLAAGAAGTWLATRWWLDQTASPLAGRAVLVALAVALGSLVVVLLGYAASLREPLALQVSTAARPGRATTLTVFAVVLVLVAAAVAVYRSGAGGAGEDDLVVFLGPALVGLAVGQVAVWVVRGVARVALGRTGHSGLAAFLASRRVARADDFVGPLRLAVAAAVFGGLALTGSLAVDRWTEAEARVATAGPTVVDAGESAVGALALTRSLDPRGENLMATAIVPSESRLAERRAYVDATRWAAVVGDFYDGTPVAQSSREVGLLAPEVTELPAVGAGRLSVSGTVLRKAPPGSVAGPFGEPVATGLTVRVDYVTAAGPGGSTEVTLRLPRQGVRDEASVRVPDCAEGCVVTGLSVERAALGGDGLSVYDDSDFDVLLDTVAVDGVDLLAQTWEPDASAVAASENNRWAPPDADVGRVLVNRPDGLQVQPLPDLATPLLLATARVPVPVLVAGDAPAAPLDLSGDERRARVVGKADTLPLVGAVGGLVDLGAAALGSGPTVPSAEVRVVVAADTPAAVLSRLEEETGSTARSLDAVGRDLRDAAGGAVAWAYALTAIACALVALLALTAGAARHRRAYRRDVAALRLVGVGTPVLRRAGQWELLVLAAVVAGAVTLGGWLVTWLLLPGLPLVDVPPAALPLDLGTRWPVLLVTAGIAGLAVHLLAGPARAASPAATRPAILREVTA